MPVTAWASPGTVTGSGWAASDAGTLVNAVALAGDPAAINEAPIDGNLILSNFGFVIPASAVIDGIEVECQGEYTTGAIVFGTFPYCGVKITKDATNPYGSEKQFAAGGPWDGAGPYTTETLGGNADMWGGAFVDTDIGAVGFGFLFNSGSSSTEGPTRGRACMFFRARVYYTEVGTPPPGVLFASRAVGYSPEIGISPQDVELSRTG